MIKFKKAFNLKLIPLLIAGVFLFNSPVYGTDLSKGTCLRKPMDFNTPKIATGRWEKIFKKIQLSIKLKNIRTRQSLVYFKPFLPFLAAVVFSLDSANAQTISGQFNTVTGSGIGEYGIGQDFTQSRIDSLKQKLKEKQKELAELESGESFLGMPGSFSFTPYYRGNDTPGLNFTYGYNNENLRLEMKAGTIGWQLGDAEAKLGLRDFLGLPGAGISFMHVGRYSPYAPLLEGMYNTKFQLEITKKDRLIAGYMSLPNSFDGAGESYPSNLVYINLKRHLERFKEGSNFEIDLRYAAEVFPDEKKKESIDNMQQLAGQGVPLDGGMFALWEGKIKHTYIRTFNEYLKLRLQNLLVYGAGENSLTNNIMLTGTIARLVLISAGIQTKTSVNHMPVADLKYLYPITELFVPFGLDVNIYGASLSVEGSYLPKTNSFSIEAKARIGSIWGYLSKNPALVEGLTAGLGISISLGGGKTETKLPGFYNFYNSGVDIRKGMHASIYGEPGAPDRFSYFGNTINDVTNNFRKNKWGFKELSGLANSLRYLEHPEVGINPSEETWTKGGGVCRDQAELLAKIMRDGLGISTARPYNVMGVNLPHAIVVAVGEKGYGKDGCVIVVNYGDVYFTDVKYEGFSSFTRAVNLIYPNLLGSSGGLSYSGAILENIIEEPIFDDISKDDKNDITRYKIRELKKDIELIKSKILELEEAIKIKTNEPGLLLESNNNMQSLDGFKELQTSL